MVVVEHKSAASVGHATHYRLGLRFYVFFALLTWTILVCIWVIFCIFLFIVKHVVTTTAVTVNGMG